MWLTILEFIRVHWFVDYLVMALISLSITWYYDASKKDIITQMLALLYVAPFLLILVISAISVLASNIDNADQMCTSKALTIITTVLYTMHVFIYSLVMVFQYGAKICMFIASVPVKISQLTIKGCRRDTWKPLTKLNIVKWLIK